MKNKSKKIIPRGAQVLVKPDEKEKIIVSENGVNKPPNTEQENKCYGTVISVGKGVDDIKKGDRVVFGAFAGDPITIDEVEYRLLHAIETPMKENEVLAFLID